MKDEIRAQTKIECSFCEIHTPRDREGIGKLSEYFHCIFEQSYLVCFNRKDEMKDVLKRMDGFELKGRKLELRPVSGFMSRDEYLQLWKVFNVDFPTPFTRFDFPCFWQ